jgi:hypothetical protein
MLSVWVKEGLIDEFKLHKVYPLRNITTGEVGSGKKRIN